MKSIQIDRRNFYMHRLQRLTDKLENDMAIVELINAAKIPDSIKLGLHKQAVGKSRQEVEILIETIQHVAKESKKVPVTPRPVVRSYQSPELLVESFNKLNRG